MEMIIENGSSSSASSECCIGSYIDEGSIESHKFYLARKTTLEMLSDRGYDVSEPELELSLNEFRSLFGENPDVERLRVSASLLSDSSKKVVVIFCGSGQGKFGSVSVFCKMAEVQELNCLILVLQSKLSPQAKQAIAGCSVKVQIFQLNDLLVNITKHVWMPKHELMSVEEKERLLKKFNVEEKQIPRMMETDAVARYYGWEKGQMVKVTYNGDLTCSHITYRCIV